MNKINDGWPAFPVSTSNGHNGHQDGPNTWQFPGMTLRDYFAAKAMQAYFSDPNAGFGRDSINEAANAAYRIADAMLAAQGKRNDSILAANSSARPAPSVPDSIIADAARYQFLRNGGAYLEPNEGEIYMATDYGAKYYKDLRDLDMDIDEALAAAQEPKP